MTQDLQGDREKYNASGFLLKNVYKPEDTDPVSYSKELGDPGQYPFTRGIYPTGYRGSVWQQNPVVGFGLPEDTNKRIKFLISQGATGHLGRTAVNLVFDLPTTWGFDVDNPEAKYEAGECGVITNTVRDMELIWEGLPIENMHISLIEHGPAPVMLALFIVAAEKQGIPREKLNGLCTNYPLFFYPVCNMAFLPPRSAMRISVDCIKFCRKEMPNWNPVNVLGYHFGESGSGPVREIAYAIAMAIDLFKACIESGMNVDEFAPQIAFFFEVGSNFFEEIAKLRAARKVWATVVHDKFGAQDMRSCRMKFLAQNAGYTLTAQEPLNNIGRIAIQTLAAVLGGAQSIATDSYDEPISIPTEETARIAIKTQKIIEHETGVADVVDPLGGSYFVESLTLEMERKIWDELDKIEKMGGAVVGIENGYFEAEIDKASLKYQMEVESGERVIVGMNKYKEEEARSFAAFKVPPETRKVAIERLRKYKEERDNEKVRGVLDKIRQAASTDGELMPLFIEGARVNATFGEMYGVLHQVFGPWKKEQILRS